MNASLMNLSLFWTLMPDFFFFFFFPAVFALSYLRYRRVSKKYNLDFGQSECIFGFVLHLQKYCYTHNPAVFLYCSVSMCGFQVHTLTSRCVCRAFFLFKKHILILIVYIATVPFLKSLVCTDWSAPTGLSRHHKPN